MIKWALVLIAVAGLLCGAAFAVDRAVSTVAGMVKDARDHAIAERDAYWEAEIAKSDLATAYAQMAASKQVAAANDAAQDKIAQVERQALETRKDSDALPDDPDSCGLSAAGVELLDH